MAVYYKFKSAKDYDSIPIDGHFISVANLKEKIFESKHLGRGTDFDLVVTNAQTNEEYLDEATLIPKNTSVLIRRVPGQPRIRIVTEPVTQVTQQDEPMVENKSKYVQPEESSFLGVNPSISKYPEDSEWDEFGNDLYEIPEVLPVQLSNPVQDVLPTSKADEDSKIRALIDTPVLDWQSQTSDGFGSGRGFGRAMGGRMMGGRGFGRGGFERRTPPEGYICYRCKVPGHFIQHCPTNGDPNFDVRRVKPPTGIPKSMLMATPGGSYALPSGAVAVLKPNEDAFEREIEGMPSTRSVGAFPPELHCPLCKEVMKDAVLTSKCCFTSFCDKCIRDYIISRSMCVCGATNILADDLLPNKTLRDTINRISESNNSSGENGGSAFQVQDMESARCAPPKITSPTQSAASKGEQIPPTNEETSKKQETVEQIKGVNAPHQKLENQGIEKVTDTTELKHELLNVKEPASQGSGRLADGEVQQKPASSETGKKKKKKKAGLPTSDAEMQWRASQDFAAKNYMVPPPMGPSPYNNPYWNGIQQPGMDGFMGPYAGGAMPYLGYGMGAMDAPFGGVFPQDPFGSQGYMLPFVPPHRDLAELAMGAFNGGPPFMRREEFEARKTFKSRDEFEAQKAFKRKREMERHFESQESSKDREFGREVSGSGNVAPPMKSKSKVIPSLSNADNHHRHRSDRHSPDRHTRKSEPPRQLTKRDPGHDHYENNCHRPESFARLSLEPPPKSTGASMPTNHKHKSVFSRISFTEEKSGDGPVKKRKLTSADSASASLARSRKEVMGYDEDRYHYKEALISRKSDNGSGVIVEYESSDDDRHFKRRRSRRYEDDEEEVVERYSRRERGREDRDRGGYIKYR
ncbi:hypothetical protein LguiB_028672 [Lonicera macranthoides]